MLRSMNSLPNTTTQDNTRNGYKRSEGLTAASGNTARTKQFNQLYETEIILSQCTPSRQSGYFPKLLGLDRVKLQEWFFKLKDGAVVRRAAYGYGNTEGAHAKVMENRKNFGAIGASFAATNKKGDNITFYLLKAIGNMLC
jgi:hypothetical protein